MKPPLRLSKTYFPLWIGRSPIAPTHFAINFWGNQLIAPTYFTINFRAINQSPLQILNLKPET